MLAIVIVAIAASAQTRGKVFTVTADTLNGNETVNFAIGDSVAKDAVLAVIE